MKQPETGKRVLSSLMIAVLSGGLGIITGGLGVICVVYGLFGLSGKSKPASVSENVVEQRDWILDELYEERVNWSYLQIDEDGWSATSINNLQKLKERVNTTDKELLIPVFPTVYTPNNEDVVYYNAILESDIEPGDKVLVIGSGTGSDAWVTSLKSQSCVYVVEINPMAIVNINTTARLGNFQVKTHLGDITKVDLPEDFSDFDYVLWNMPYIYPHEDGSKLEGRNYHDGDDGTILKSFLSILPSLLKKDGQAILLNTSAAQEYIQFPDLVTQYDGDVLVYVFSFNAD
jgi:tRNA1(Val) A37 N6-methylase TrmN6